MIDLLLALLFALAVFMAARRGFFRTVLQLGAWVASIALAGALGAALAQPVYEGFFAAPARALIEQNIGAAVDSSQAAQYAQKVITELPAAVQQLAGVAGVSTEGLIDNLQEGFTTADAAALIEQSVVAPIAVAVIRFAMCLGLFALLLLVLRLLARKLGKVRDIPVFKQADWILGAALGIVKGVLLVLVVALALRAAAAMNDGGAFALAVEKSRIAALTEGVFGNR
ncbi:MAG: CvpA family protein [Oscillospiraceae bacterium]|nr:CvpA family protein [Oscillospiraceae bacterium]